MAIVSCQRLAASLFGGVLALAAVQAQAQGAGPAYVDSALHLQFPAKLGDLAYWKTVTYPNKALGYCIVYEGKHSLGQICVFDFGHPNLSTGIANKEFTEALKTAEDGMTRLITTAPYRKGQLTGGGPVAIDGEGRKAQAEVRLFTSEMGPEEAPIQNQHLILMTTGLGKFLKLNFTATNLKPDEFAEESKQVIKDFIEANRDVLKKLLLAADG
jgi:hypothetical protein